MRINKRYAFWLLALAFFSSAIARDVPAQNQRFTRRLPQIDKVELQKVSSAEFGIGSIEATKQIEGSDAQKIAGLWRTQRWSRMGFACHQPGYALKFFSRGKMLFYASVCWDCHNVYFLEPKPTTSAGFAADGMKGKQLLALFKTLMR